MLCPETLPFQELHRHRPERPRHLHSVDGDRRLHQLQPRPRLLGRGGHRRGQLPRPRPSPRRVRLLLRRGELPPRSVPQICRYTLCRYVKA